MGKLAADISMSLDGFVAGPNPTLERPLGDGGDGLHEWVFPLEAWRKPHGLPGGETNASTKRIGTSLGNRRKTLWPTTIAAPIANSAALSGFEAGV